MIVSLGSRILSTGLSILRGRARVVPSKSMALSIHPLELQASFRAESQSRVYGLISVHRVGLLEQLLLWRCQALDPSFLVKTDFWRVVNIFTSGWRTKKCSERPLFEFLWSQWRGGYGCRERGCRFSFQIRRRIEHNCLDQPGWGRVDLGGIQPPIAISAGTK